jgi:hypothetical protein
MSSENTTKMYLTKSGLSVPLVWILKHWVKKYRSKFTLYNKDFDGKMVSTQTYAVNRPGGYMILPRMKGLSIFGNSKDINTKELQLINQMSEGQDIPKYRQHVDGLELVLNQTLARDYLMANNFSPRHVKAGLGSAIIDLEPGQGKTFLAISIIPEYWKKTLIIVPNKTLLAQWVVILEKYFPKLYIGQYYGDKKIDGDIIVGVVNSIASSKTFLGIPADKWFNYFGLVIYDEIHKYCSPTFRKVFNRTNAPVVLGMSGTCFERNDGNDAVSHHHVGTPIIVKNLPGYLDPAKAIGWTTRIDTIKYQGHPRYIKKILGFKGWASFPLMVTQFLLDPFRTQLIVQKAMEYYNQGRNIFIFVDRRRFVLLFTNIFRSIFKDIEIEAPELDSNYVMGGVTEDRKNHAKHHGRICCVTYEAAGTGLSYDRYDTIIYATPRRTGHKQYMNRAYRLGGDSKVTRVICDLVDWSTSIKNQYYDRKKVYISERCPNPSDSELRGTFEIETTTVDWKSIALSKPVKTVYNDPKILADIRDDMKKYMEDVSVFHEDVEGNMKQLNDLDKINHMIDKMFELQLVGEEPDFDQLEETEETDQ